ncbi:Abnormal spindle-like microcephaly-associated protein like protein [Chelonia mydas]|uniref:Abnormal spindle-like microcephaly-associated protein like protein n=1 Tax=Chelonia mydas TaxID=8469 RepID=M7BKD8_CHEMY|nr:Abnormal spindle-like microcephaly-associated protein like protein [Chelonia mydas]
MSQEKGDGAGDMSLPAIAARCCAVSDVSELEPLCRLPPELRAPAGRRGHSHGLGLQQLLAQPAQRRDVSRRGSRSWQLARAATLIQAFWRGCQARRALREQREAAIRIQSAFRGYRTRTYLSEVGILSEGETEEESDSAWSSWPVRCR